MKFIDSETIRFFIAGLANTIFTYLVYLALFQWAGYVPAFTISFALGIIFSFVVYAVYVFRAPLIWRELIQYPGVYLTQYLVGLLLLAILVDYLGIDGRIAPVINVAILVPISFLFNKWFFKKRGRTDA